MSFKKQSAKASEAKSSLAAKAERAEGLRAMLGERGASLTKQRMEVFDYLSRVDHHPTAEEVFLAVKPELPKISLATVYKNLEALVAIGAASKLTYGDGAARYDIRTDHHYHSRCLGCGKVADLEARGEKELAALVKAPSGFLVEDYRVEVVGYCKDCKRNL